MKFFLAVTRLAATCLAGIRDVRVGTGGKRGDRHTRHTGVDVGGLLLWRPSLVSVELLAPLSALLMTTLPVLPVSASPFAPTLKQANKSSPALPPPPSPDLSQDSPVLRRWRQAIPDLQHDIRNDPAFRTRLRAGYAFFPRGDSSGLSVAVEDIFIGQTGLTLSGEYQQGWGGGNGRDRQSIGADLRYYVLPLGSYVNLAPVVGYRRLETSAYTTEGVNLGVRLMVSLSRTGAADLSLSQTWVAPGSEEEVGITTLSAGYALTRHLRISTDLQKQNAPQRRDSRVGILLEWML